MDVTIQQSIMNSDLKQTTSLTDENKEFEGPWPVIESYFRGKHLQQLVKHQVESYNDFVNYQVQKTISMFNSVNIAWKFS